MNTRTAPRHHTSQLPGAQDMVASPAPRRISILDEVANRYGMDPLGFQKTLRETVFKGASNEEFAALLVVANEHKLNPLTKEIYAFKAQGGGIVPLVSIDGWIRIMNEHPAFDGIEYQDIPDAEGNLMAIECTIFRADRSHPIKVIEYLSECKRPTAPWRDMPARMLRHKATIQCARYAFGFSGIYTEDDVEHLAYGGDIRHVESVPPMRNARAIEHQEQAEQSGGAYDPQTGEVLRDDDDEDRTGQQQSGAMAPTYEEASAAITACRTPDEVNEQLTELRPFFHGEDLADINMVGAERIDELLKQPERRQTTAERIGALAGGQG